MKISYILQLKDFSIMFIIGLALGIVYGLLNIFSTIKHIIILQILSDILFCAITFITILISINLVNMGEYRLFLVLGITAGFIFERITFGKLFAKWFKKLYNILAKLVKKFANSRLGRIVLK